MEINAVIDYIARTNLFNFVIFAGIIIFLVKKLKVNTKMANAADEIKKTIENSEIAKSESETKLSAIEESMTHLAEEVDAIIAESDERAELVGAKIIDSAEKAVLVVKDNTEKALENSRMLLKNDLIRRASLASVEIAKAHIREELSKNAELHNKLIEESIDAIEGVEL